MEEPTLEPTTTMQTDPTEPTDLNTVVDNTFTRYQEKNFHFVEINHDPTLFPVYTELRKQYGEDLTKEQIQIFYDRLEALNCSLVSDWAVADVRENYSDVTANKMLMAALKVNKPISEPMNTDMAGHAFVHIENGEKELFFEPQTGKKFSTLEEALVYYNASWPLPEGYRYFAI